MQRINIIVGLFAFFGLMGGMVDAQQIPEEVRIEVARNLEGSFIVFREAVQDDLDLTSEQKDTLEQYLQTTIPDIMQFFQKMQGLKPEDREKEIKAFRPKAQEKLAVVLKETLRENQLKRLHQLALQKAGAFALLHGGAEIRKSLEITDDQRKQFMMIVQGLQKSVEPLVKEAQSGGNHEEIRSKVMKLRKEHELKIEALLTDTQKQQWKEMLGRPLDLDD